MNERAPPQNTPERETLRRVFDMALDDLIVMLKEAQAYLGSDGTHDDAAIGTLIPLDRHVDNLKAAQRMFVSSRRRA